MVKQTGLDEREQKRENIMKAALKIFSQKGFSPAALDEVAQEAGIAKGTLYLYFKDKEDLFCSTILNVIDDLANFLREHIDEKMGPIQVLESIAYHQLQFFSQNRDVYGIFQTLINDNLLCSHKRLFSLLLEKKQELIDYETSIVERGKRKGVIRSDLKTEDIVNSFDGIVTNAIRQLGIEANFASPIDVEGRARSIMKVLLEGISGRNGCD
jgi:AcrR family transcriptional regulator